VSVGGDPCLPCVPCLLGRALLPWQAVPPLSPGQVAASLASLVSLARLACPVRALPPWQAVPPWRWQPPLRCQPPRPPLRCQPPRPPLPPCPPLRCQPPRPPLPPCPPLDGGAVPNSIACSRVQRGWRASLPAWTSIGGCPVSGGASGGGSLHGGRGGSNPRVTPLLPPGPPELLATPVDLHCFWM